MFKEAIDAALGPTTGFARAGMNSATPLEIPGPGDLWDAYLADRLSRQQAEEWLLLHGIFSNERLGAGLPFYQPAMGKRFADMWQAVLGSRQTKPNTGDLFQMFARGLFDEGRFRQELRKQGVIDPDYLSWYTVLTNALPGPSDLVSFAVKDVWNPQAIKTFGYDQEYPEQVGYYLGLQSLNYPLKDQLHLAAGLPDLTWARAYWYSHWQLPGPGQAIEMYHRLRRSIRNPNVSSDPSGLLFEKQELELFLKTADYPTYWRGRLAAIGYKPIGMRVVGNLIKSGLADEVAIVEILQDQGYNLRDATLQSRALFRVYAEQQLAPGRKVSTKLIVAAYNAGTLTRDDALVQLHRLTLTGQDQVDEFDRLGAALQIVRAAGNQVNQQLLDNTDLANKLKRIGRRVKLIRKAYLKGGLAGFDPDKFLQQLGLTPEAIRELLAEWQVELALSARSLSVAQIVRQVRDLMMSADEARQRLKFFGYPDEEADYLLIDARLEGAARQARALKQISAGYEARQKAAVAAARQAKQQAAQAQAALAKSANLGRLERWLEAGLISPEVFLRRAGQLGIEPEDAGRIVAQAQQKADKAAQKAALACAPKCPAKRKAVTQADIRRWVSKGVIGDEEAAARLMGLGYSAIDAADLIRDAHTPNPPKGGASGSGSSRSGTSASAASSAT